MRIRHRNQQIHSQDSHQRNQEIYHIPQLCIFSFPMDVEE